jgi:hypothetical protein
MSVAAPGAIVALAIPSCPGVVRTKPERVTAGLPEGDLAA